MSFNNLSHAEQQSFSSSRTALYNRFEPDSKREFYKVQFDNLAKPDEEDWADYGDSLLLIVTKVYLDMTREAREQLALSYFPNQLRNPQIALGVRQRRPKSVQEAVTLTIELESYLLRPTMNCKSSSLHDQTATQANIVMQTSMVEALQELLCQVKQLEIGLERRHNSLNQ